MWVCHVCVLMSGGWCQVGVSCRYYQEDVSQVAQLVSHGRVPVGETLSRSGATFPANQPHIKHIH